MSSLTATVARQFGQLNRLRVQLHKRFRGFASSSKQPRPARLVQGDRSTDNAFRWYHALYQRCSKEDMDGDRLNPNRIKYENASVNWAKYSRPWDVIFDYPGCGFVQFIVLALPKGIPRDIPPDTAPNNKPEPHWCKPAHVPEPDNYSHSEIWTFKPAGRVASGKLGSLAKKEFRQILSDHGVLLQEPTV